MSAVQPGDKTPCGMSAAHLALSSYPQVDTHTHTHNKTAQHTVHENCLYLRCML